LRVVKEKKGGGGCASGTRRCALKSNRNWDLLHFREQMLRAITNGKELGKWVIAVEEGRGPEYTSFQVVPWASVSHRMRSEAGG